MANVKKFAQKLQIIEGGVEYLGGLTGDTLGLANGAYIDTILESSATTNATNIIYTEKALKEYVDTQVSSVNEIGELTDVSITGLEDNQILVSTGGTWENLLKYQDSLTYNGSGSTTLITENGIISHLEDMSEVTNSFTGFEEYDDSQYSISGRNVTIEPTGSTFNIFFNSKKITISSSKSITISTTEGSHYIYFDENGDLQEIVNPSETEAIDLIQGDGAGVYAAYVYWNNSDTEAPYFAVERHAAKRNNRLHIYQHLTEGTRHESGGLISDFTLNEDSTTGITVSITPGYFWDEDQRFTYSDGTNNSDFVQEITPNLVAPMIYKTGSIWSKYDASEFLFQTGGTGGVQYNSIDGSLNGSQTEITGTGYTYTYIAETNDPRHPIVKLQGQHFESTLSEAENDALDNFANLKTQGLPFQEIKVIWIIIGYADTTLTNSGNYTIAKTIDVRDNQYNVLSGVAGSATNTAASITTDTNSFNNVLGGGDTNVQKALNTIDDNVYTKSYIDSNFYTQTELNNGQLDNRYYTETESDANFLSASTTVNDLGGYTTTEVDNNFLSATTWLSGLTDVEYDTLAEGDTLIYSGGTWINSTPIEFTELGYLTSGETDTRYVNVDGDIMTGDLTLNSGLTLGGHRIDDIVDSSGGTNSSTIIYTEKALKEYVGDTVAGVTASNGLTKSGADIQLGGSLTKDTIIDGAYDLTFDNTNINITGNTNIEGPLNVTGNTQLIGGLDINDTDNGIFYNSNDAFIEFPSNGTDSATIQHYYGLVIRNSFTNVGINFDTSGANELGITADLTTFSGDIDANTNSITGGTAYLTTANISSLSLASSTNITAVDEDTITNINDNTIATTSAITSYISSELGSFSTTLSGLDDTNITSPQNNHVLQYVSGEWVNSSNLTITGIVNITGDLYVSGTTTTVNTQDLNVADRLILINSGETGAGVTNNLAGIEVERGTETNYQFLFDETDDVFKVGQVGDLQAVATREDNPTVNGLTFWNNTDSRFDTDTELTYNNSTNVLTIGSSTFGNSVSINSDLTVGGNIIFDGDTITGITTSITDPGSVNELATTSAIVTYVGNEISTANASLISGLTFSGDTGGADFVSDTFTIIGGTDISTTIGSDSITLAFTGAYYNTFNADSGTDTAIGSDSFTFTGGSGITTSISGDVLTISNDSEVTKTLTVSNGASGQTEVVGVQSIDGSAIVDYYMTSGSKNQEGQIRVLLNGSSSGFTRDYQGDDITFTVELTDDDGTGGNDGNIAIKITNSDGNTIDMKYTTRNVSA